jgi:hypothetical protein
MASLKTLRLPIVLVVLAVWAGPASAAGDLSAAVATPAGTWAGITYTQYDGVFTGATSTGTYRVPYRITAPADLHKGNRTVVVEPPHAAAGLGALDGALGRDLFFTRGFAHAGIGWSTTNFGPGEDLRILDPSVPGVFINGGFTDPDFGGNTDDEIITDFARTLKVDADARSMLGHVKRRYLTGFSDSADPVMRILNGGHAEGVFDLVFPWIAFGDDPQTMLAGGGHMKVVIVDSEWQVESSANFVDRGVARDRYRSYSVAGSPHIPDIFDGGFASMTTPASYQPELRAHFLQAHLWVTRHQKPADSSQLLMSGGALVRDANGNAISIDAKGHPLPRLPILELGEARFFGDDFLGTYDQVKTLADLGFRSKHATKDYLHAFDKALDEYAKAYDILPEDQDAMLRRAALCPGLTYSEAYRDHYDAFAAIAPC